MKLIGLEIYLKDQIRLLFLFKELLEIEKLTKLEKNIFEFLAAIKYKNFNLFSNIVDENKFQLKFEIFWDLQNGIFRVENLLPTFQALYGKRFFTSTSELLRELQKYNSSLFGMHNIKMYKNSNNELKEYFCLFQIYAR